jgi:hypothetical protein
MGVDSDTWALMEEDKFRMTAVDVKCFKKTAKYTLLGHIRNQNILKELKTQPVMGTLTLQWRWSLNCNYCQGQRGLCL